MDCSGSRIASSRKLQINSFFETNKSEFVVSFLTTIFFEIKSLFCQVLAEKIVVDKYEINSDSISNYNVDSLRI